MLAIKHILFLHSNFSNKCKSLINEIPDEVKSQVNFVNIDSKGAREAIKNKITEVPSCMVVTQTNSLMIYQGYNQTRNFLVSISSNEEEKGEDSTTKIHVEDVSPSAQRGERKEEKKMVSFTEDIPEKRIKKGEGLQGCASSSLQNIGEDLSGGEGFSQPPTELTREEDIPDEAKERRKTGKLNISEVLRQGQEISAQNERKDGRPQQ